jgi:hypothetical protein
MTRTLLWATALLALGTAHTGYALDAVAVPSEAWVSGGSTPPAVRPTGVSERKSTRSTLVAGGKEEA